MDSPAPYWDGGFFELVNVLATMNILDSRHMVLDRFFSILNPDMLWYLESWHLRRSMLSPNTFLVELRRKKPECLMLYTRASSYFGAWKVVGENMRLMILGR